jgi:hypothetical protein
MLCALAAAANDAGAVLRIVDVGPRIDVDELFLIATWVMRQAVSHAAGDGRALGARRRVLRITGASLTLTRLREQGCG